MTRNNLHSFKLYPQNRQLQALSHAGSSVDIFMFREKSCDNGLKHRYCERLFFRSKPRPVLWWQAPKPILTKGLTYIITQQNFVIFRLRGEYIPHILDDIASKAFEQNSEILV